MDECRCGSIEIQEEPFSAVSEQVNTIEPLDEVLNRDCPKRPGEHFLANELPPVQIREAALVLPTTT